VPREKIVPRQRRRRPSLPVSLTTATGSRWGTRRASSTCWARALRAMPARNAMVDSGLRGGTKPEVSAVSRHACPIRRASAGCCSLAATPSGSGVAEPSWRRDVRRARGRHAKCSRRSSHTVRRTRRARRGPSSISPWVSRSRAACSGRRRCWRAARAAAAEDEVGATRGRTAAAASSGKRRRRSHAAPTHPLPSDWSKWKRSSSSAARHRGEHHVPQRERAIHREGVAAVCLWRRAVQ
jgi:hypothetical protein